MLKAIDKKAKKELKKQNRSSKMPVMHLLNHEKLKEPRRELNEHGKKRMNKQVKLKVQ